MTELPSVYVETSLLSYLAARPSNNLIVAGQQELSRQWWEFRRAEYRLFISELVTDEATRKRRNEDSTLPLDYCRLNWTTNQTG